MAVSPVGFRQSAAQQGAEPQISKNLNTVDVRPASRRRGGSASVLINPKDPHAVQLGQLGDEHREQGERVDHEMGPVVFGVEAGQYVPGSEGNERIRSHDHKGRMHSFWHFVK